MNKPKEFWLTIDEPANDDCPCDRGYIADDKEMAAAGDKVIHVIDYALYEDANAGTKYWLSQFKSVHTKNEILFKEVERLKDVIRMRDQGDVKRLKYLEALATEAKALLDTVEYYAQPVLYVNVKNSSELYADNGKKARDAAVRFTKFKELMK